jgi:hypothetical protein
VKPISVPRTPKSAYNPRRRVSDLLKAHISNLEAVTGRGTGPTPKRKPKNEAQASAYIAELTRQLHPDLYASAAPPAPTPSPGALGLAAPAQRRRTARKKKTPVRAATTRRRQGSRTGRKKRKSKKRKTTRRSSSY